MFSHEKYMYNYELPIRLYFKFASIRTDSECIVCITTVTLSVTSGDVDKRRSAYECAKGNDSEITTGV